MHRVSAGGALVAVVLLLPSGGTLFWSACRDAGASPAQPLAFPHAPHTKNQIACVFCHDLVEDHAAAGFPATELCGSCHSAMPQESEATQKLMQYVDAGQQIPWVRLYRLPQYNYFPHKWHLRAGVDCEECHGDIGTSRVATRHIDLRMQWCLDCHEARGASVDCVTCHK